jgi:hypothetical protein
MATPVRRPAASTPVPYTPAAPVPVVAPLGWILALAAGIGLLLATWAIYPDDYEGMWAGYRDDLIGIVVVIAALALRSSLPKRPAVGLIGLCGALLVLFAVFIDDGAVVFVTELAAGVVLLLATALQAGSARG